jgi:hypothetical protein
MHLSVNALMLKMATHASGVACWLTVVYGPRGDRYKLEFIQELRTLHSSRVGLWLLGGDFNLTYRAHDKNNGRLNIRLFAMDAHVPHHSLRALSSACSDHTPLLL